MKIVLCGSMKVKESIIEIAKKLENMGHIIELPEECMRNEPKETASRAHFNCIASPKTDAILVVNTPKNGIENYIGPNSLAEIALAFYYHKKIFLLGDRYEPYKEELIAWKSVPLKNQLEEIK